MKKGKKEKRKNNTLHVRDKVNNRQVIRINLDLQPIISPFGSLLSYPHNSHNPPNIVAYKRHMTETKRPVRIAEKSLILVTLI